VLPIDMHGGLDQLNFVVIISQVITLNLTKVEICMRTQRLAGSLEANIHSLPACCTS
jgi:hypothetical protein